ncbi:S9 family peptidase [Neobacillus kokaensis]|uniref:Peptidase YuxL n=1 Tax=Neobacillus kokaensis TaxID=2759023 RepID=A0ABQ3N0M1_9BACI|nr:S9 family peptidase [Neobacillus kokaensis]GHH97107.1 putative peptidase YuxL [Neobacillus kokaensis]
MTARRGIKTEDLYQLKSVANPQLSPDGNAYVFAETTINRETDEYESHLFFNSLNSNKKPFQWTFGKGKNHSPRWSPDGKTLAFVSNRSGKSQIYLLSLSGGEAMQLTFLDSGAVNPVWSPDGRKIAFNTSLKEEKTIFDKQEEKKEAQVKPLEVTQMKYKSDSDGFWQGQYRQIAIIDVLSGELNQLTEGAHNFSLFSWSPDGRYLAVGADISKEVDFSFLEDIFYLDVESKELTAVTKGTGYFSNAEWSPDGSYLAMFGHEQQFENATQTKIWLFHMHTKQLSCITANWDVPVGNLMVGDFLQGVTSPNIIWTKNSDGFYFIATERGSTNIYYSDLSGTVKAVLSDGHHVYGLSIDPKKQVAIAAISKPTEISDLYLVSLSDSRIIEKLTDINKEFLSDIALSQPEVIEFKGADGWKVQGWLMKPLGFKEGEKYPLILEIHGGPHMMYGNTYMNEFQILAEQGYAVLYINPRGSHGYSQEFVNAVRGDYGGNDYQDLMLGMDYVLANYDFIDENRLGVTGGSYGGFMTNWIVGHTSRFKAAVTQRSISNWISFYGVSDIGYYFTEWQIKADLADVETLWKHSPLAYVHHVKTPLLILHSEKDYRCPIEQAEQLFIALKRLGKETKFVRFPEENHELSRSGKPELRINRLDYIVNWFNKYI